MAQRAARLKREREAMNREEARAMKRMRLDWADLPSEILVLVMQEVARLPPDEQDDDSKPETHRGARSRRSRASRPYAAGGGTRS